MSALQPAPQETATGSLVLTHGTLEIRDVQQSMAFYRDFLGMEVVQHVPFGCRIALGGPWYIVCLEVKHDHDMSRFNHFGLDCASRAEVEAWHARAVAERERYEFADITKPNEGHGTYRFHIKDRDNNWWEIEHYEGDPRETNLSWGNKLLEKAAQRRAHIAAQAPPAAAES